MKSIKNFPLSRFASYLLKYKYKKFFLLSGLEKFFRASWNITKFHFLKHKKSFGCFCFLKYKNSFLLRKYKFLGGFRFLKYKIFSWGRLKSSLSQNISFFKVSVSWNVRNFFFGVSISLNFLILEIKSSTPWNMRNFFQGGFFYFLSLGWKVLEIFKSELNQVKFESKLKKNKYTTLMG